jgi:hypothetical protein
VERGGLVPLPERPDPVPGIPRMSTGEVDLVSAAHLVSDEFFHFIRTGYVEPWKAESHEQNDVVMTAVAEAATTFALGGYFTVADGILIPGWSTSRWRRSRAGRGSMC